MTAEVAIDQTVDLVSSGVGSAWSNINITTDDYKPSFTYTDKCSVSSQTACYPKRPKTTTATTPYLTYYTSNATATDNLEASTTSDTITDNPQDKSTTDNPHDFTRNVTSNPQYSTPRAITTSIQPTSTTGTNIPTTVSNPPDSTRNLLSTDKSLDESTKIIIHTDNPLDSTKIATNTENQTDFTENITTTLDSIRNVTSTSSPENPTITITEESPECDDNDDVSRLQSVLMFYVTISLSLSSFYFSFLMILVQMQQTDLILCRQVQRVTLLIFHVMSGVLDKVFCFFLT